MIDILGRMSPLLILILFGYILQRTQYFEEVSYKRLLHFTLTFVIPCLLFTTFMDMQFQPRYALVSVVYIGFMALLLAAGFLLQKLFKFKHRFFPLILTGFGFGVVGLPLFVTMFGIERAHYMAVLGVGHEVFVALVYLPFSRMYLSGEKFSIRNVIKHPFLIMVSLALFVRLTGMEWLLTDNMLGVGIFSAIRGLGGMTLVIAMILVGYRLRFNDKATIKISVLYYSLRLAAVLAIGIPFMLLVISPVTAGSVMFNHAFMILSLTHSSIAVIALVGNYCPKEDQVIINNVFVLSVITGFVLFFLYMVLFV